MRRIGAYVLTVPLLCLGLGSEVLAQGGGAAGEIVTTGSAERSLRPDRATVRIGIEAHATTAGEASALVSSRLKAVQDSLRVFPATLDSLRLVAFNVGPNYDYSDGKKLIDYEASAVLQLSVRALDLIGALVDKALAAGATDIPGMIFHSDSSEAARRHLLATAMADARADAVALATAGGQRLGTLLRVSTLPPQGFVPGFAEFGYSGYGGRVMGLQPGVVGSVGPREVPVRVTVFSTWRLVPGR